MESPQVAWIGIDSVYGYQCYAAVVQALCGMYPFDGRTALLSDTGALGIQSNPIRLVPGRLASNNAYV